MGLEANPRSDGRNGNLLSRLIRDTRMFAALAAMVVSASPVIAEDQPVFPGPTWESVSPAKVGWSKRRLEAAREYAEKIGSTAVLIVQDGRVVASWGDVQKKMQIYSMRKSIISALYGVAVAKNQINLDKTLAELGIDDKPPSLTAVEKTATIRDLLKARSGIYHDASFETDTMKERRPERGSHAPGTFWYYNNWDFNVLGVILRRATGEDTFAAVAKYLAQPLGMEDFTPEDGRYIYDKSTDHPAYPMRFTARDLARFGWLYVNRGKWHDQQVIPLEWVRESTKSYSNTDRGTGYGYMWWVAKGGKQFRTDVGRGAFSARGNGGQYIIVAPKPRIVVVHLNDRQKRSKLKKGGFAKLLRLIFDAAPK
jgi:CubicO group peptidase (beta-lactamase class C family)